MDLLENDDMQEKLRKLPSGAQVVFLCAVDEMYRMETGLMLQFIGESRMEMADTATDIQTEQCALRETAERLALSRLEGIDRDEMREYIKKKRQNGRYSAMSSRTGIAQFQIVQEYQPNKAKYQPHRGDSASLHDYSDQDDVSLPEMEDDLPQDLYEEEKDEILAHMSHGQARVRTERERQQARVAEMRERVAQKKLHVADQLLREASDLERVKLSEQERQKTKIAERIAAKKREKTMLSLAPDSPTLEPAELLEENENRKERKAKKEKKKKHKDQDYEGDESDNGNAVKRKKSKKKKKKESENTTSADELNEGAEKKNKKKKKKEVEHGEDDEDGLKRDRKKKSKKKAWDLDDFVEAEQQKKANLGETDV